MRDYDHYNDMRLQVPRDDHHHNHLHHFRVHYHHPTGAGNDSHSFSPARHLHPFTTCSHEREAFSSCTYVGLPCGANYYAISISINPRRVHWRR
jgi:hypothetical protein